jgi:hypothetical protein
MSKTFVKAASILQRNSKNFANYYTFQSFLSLQAKFCYSIGTTYEEVSGYHQLAQVSSAHKLHPHDAMQTTKS